MNQNAPEDMLHGEVRASNYASSVGTIIRELSIPSADVSDDIRRSQLLETLMQIESYNTAGHDVGRYMRVIITFSELVVNLLEVTGPLGFVFRAVLAVASLIFRQDIATTIERLLKDQMEADLKRKCWAASRLFKECIAYLTALPAATQLAPGQRDVICSRLASDCPIAVGGEVLGSLDFEIIELSKRNDLKDLTDLLKKIQIYCCLSTFREVFLLARLSRERDYGFTSGVMAVLQCQRQSDASLLKILYKPERSQLAIYFAFKRTESVFPIVTEFLIRRGLQLDLNFLNERNIRIWSERYSDSCLSSHDAVILTCIRCQRRERGNEGRNTIFVCRSVPYARDIFTIHPDGRMDLFVYTNFWLRYGFDPQRWHILPVEPDNRNTNSVYLIMPEFRLNDCIFTDRTGLVNVHSRSDSDQLCFWTIELIDDAAVAQPEGRALPES